MIVRCHLTLGPVEFLHLVVPTLTVGHLQLRHQSATLSEVFIYKVREGVSPQRGKLYLVGLEHEVIQAVDNLADGVDVLLYLLSV